MTRQIHCNHSTYWSARPDCPKCRTLFGHIPESPAFTGNWVERRLLLLIGKIRHVMRERNLDGLHWWNALGSLPGRALAKAERRLRHVQGNRR
jgi:hypothetical protein